MKQSKTKRKEKKRNQINKTKQNKNSIIRFLTIKKNCVQSLFDQLLQPMFIFFYKF